MNSGEYILPKFYDSIKDHALTEEAAETTIVVSTLGKDATVLGAVARFLVEIFE